jgi:hypothetical protein
MSSAYEIIQQAINESIDWDRTQDVPWSQEIETEIMAECDDWHPEERTFWGTNDDGQHWQIRLIR